LIFVLWFGCNVMGSASADIEKPLPEIVAELTVTGAVPVETNVTDSWTGTFTASLPNARLPVLTLRVAV